MKLCYFIYVYFVNAYYYIIISFIFFHMTTGKFKMTLLACIILLLGTDGLDIRVMGSGIFPRLIGRKYSWKTSQQLEWQTYHQTSTWKYPHSKQWDLSPRPRSQMRGSHRSWATVLLGKASPFWTLVSQRFYFLSLISFWELRSYPGFSLVRNTK